MKEIIAKLINDLANFKTLTIVMFIILPVLLMNNMIPTKDNSIFYYIICLTISVAYTYINLNNNFDIKQENNLQ